MCSSSFLKNSVNYSNYNIETHLCLESKVLLKIAVFPFFYNIIEYGLILENSNQSGLLNFPVAISFPYSLNNFLFF